MKQAEKVIELFMKHTPEYTQKIVMKNIEASSLKNLSEK